jgi:hypothetical protein
MFWPVAMLMGVVCAWFEARSAIAPHHEGIGCFEEAGFLHGGEPLQAASRSIEPRKLNHA